MRTWHLALLLGVALLLTGCAGDVIGDLYVQDIIDAMELEDDVFTIGTVSIQSVDPEYMDQVIEFFNLFFREPSNFRDQSRDYTSYTMADVKIPVVDITYFDPVFPEDIIAFVVAFDEEDESVWFGVAVNKDRFAEAAAYVQENFWQQLSFSDFTLQLRLINDTRETVTASVYSLYVNQQPVLFLEDYSLARRDMLELRLSDVMRDYAYEEGFVLIGSLK
ncbi:MAG: DUF7424 family protein [Limnochordia bacterium]|jgi:hypothetical protein|nr:MAG: hypothetical protein AA931_10170 [Peptococcaceae bacterium 1109]